LEVIDNIEVFKNDDDYVYEIETESHWYNCGGFITHNCATPEFLMYMDYFIRKEYGEDYYKRSDEVVDLSVRKRSIDKVISDCFEQVVYSLNQPTGARNFQAVFWNVAYYDRYYFQSIFGDFKFPDGTAPVWDSLSWLQKRFMKWFNAERTKTVLTFPVESMALLSDNGEPKDKEYGDFTAEMYAEGHSFFTYMSDKADSLSSCCRLRNEIQNNGFSYTLGAGGVSTGSKSVLTINLNRCIQYAVKHGKTYMSFLEEIVDLVHKVQLAYNENLKELLKKGMLPLFDAGYININRQYLTIGVNGLVEGAEFLQIPIKDCDEYSSYVQSILGLVETYNKKYRTKEVMFNCEMIPAENVGVKHAKWDKEDGYFVPRDCYNSYFYIVEDENTNVIDKFKLHGKKYIEHLTGGSALHCNLDEHLSFEQYKQLLKVAAKEGCNYFTFNIPNTICNDCGTIDKRYLKKCPKCGSENVDYITRVIGYIKRVSNFSSARQKEAAKRYYADV
jgi:ribonucleoside-triphosphate reductase